MYIHVFLANLLSEDWSEDNLGWSPFLDRMLYKCIILGTMPITQTNTGIINPLTLNIKEQIVPSFSHTFLIKVHWGDVTKISRDFTLGDHILNSHDLRGGRSIDITRRNLMLITVNTMQVRIILACLLCMPNRFLAMLC